MKCLRPAGLALLLTTALAGSPELPAAAKAAPPGAPAPPATATAQRGEPTPTAAASILTGATLWDGTGSSPLEDSAVVIRDGRILATGRRDQVGAPAKARRIDLSGKFLMPGLIDSHVHFSAAGTIAVALEQAEVDGLLRSARCAGITTMLAVDGSERSRAAAALARRRSDLPAVLWAAGPYLAAAAPDSALWPERIRQDFEAGASMLALAPAGADSDWALLRRLVTLSHGSSRPALGFTLLRQEALGLLEVGIHRFVHTVTDRPLTADDLQAFRDAGAGMSSTAAVWLSLTGAAVDQAMAAAAAIDARCTSAARRDRLGSEALHRARATAAGLAARSGAAEANLRRLIAAGAPLAAGSDAGTLDLNHGAGLHRELTALEALGMTPRQALLAATRDAAAFLGVAGQTGTLSLGREADLLVLDRSPLDDLSALTDIHALVLDGQWLDRTLLDSAGAAASERLEKTIGLSDQ